MDSAVWIGVVELVCLALYLIPRTSVLGAILLTGYLGGAVAAQVRIEAPVFSTLLFPVYTGVLLWVGLYLRDADLRELVPLRRASRSCPPRPEAPQSGRLPDSPANVWTRHSAADDTRGRGVLECPGRRRRTHGRGRPDQRAARSRP
ncbi:MAG: DoxX family protein, partial [Nocardioidaceae bacterium]